MLACARPLSRAGFSPRIVPTSLPPQLTRRFASRMSSPARRAVFDALVGALAADALAMPVHWYYDRRALVRDYGALTGTTFLPPRNPHPDSILWRSRYSAVNERGDILREQAQYWGKRGVHYHQFVPAGGNTLNFALAAELYEDVRGRGGVYDADAWLARYVSFMLTPGRHTDTYVEEYHRAFFTNYARGTPPAQCGIEDIHIGGLAQVPALVAALREPRDATAVRALVRKHVSLTHRAEGVLRAADTLTRILLAVVDGGVPLRAAIEREAADWVTPEQLAAWAREKDDVVVGSMLSPACYIDESFPASLFLSWKYADSFSAGIAANANVGGDNCHRGAVVGALLGAANGVPDALRSGLAVYARLAGL